MEILYKDVLEGQILLTYMEDGAITWDMLVNRGIYVTLLATSKPDALVVQEKKLYAFDWDQATRNHNTVVAYHYFNGEFPPWLLNEKGLEHA